MVLRRRKSKKDEKERSGFSRAFVEIAVELAVWVFSTILVTLGVFLFLFGLLDFGPDARLRTLFIIVLVPVAVYVLIRIARQILDDLRSGGSS